MQENEKRDAPSRASFREEKVGRRKKREPQRERRRTTVSYLLVSRVVI
jgi:hypothetical protein